MLLKAQFNYLRRSFEKYVEHRLEEAIYNEYANPLVLEIYTSPIEMTLLTFDPKEVDLVVKELIKKGYKVDEDTKELIPVGNKIQVRTITIHTR